MGSKYARPIMVKLRQDRGNKCLQCNCINNLQFAHVRPTGLMGNSRGMEARMFDIKKHPNDYILLCRDCHLIFDKIHLNTTRKKRGGGGIF